MKELKLREFSDSPQCACPVVSAFLRRWNDGMDDVAYAASSLRPTIAKMQKSAMKLVVNCLAIKE